ncbi:hypothetical protein [Blastococcus sp. KM273129]|uniref:hypothetical protein n=1 Tax=Blastococcus sp. KM273129 TaxID=2570315 RepID=UPI001F268E7B|nr:hypothetical protein [Blastococcus sp. KM273129]MCF6736940.1 hypothetical protein [Blastococcus sp. KM273129]
MLWAWSVGIVVWLFLSGVVAVTLGRGIRLADDRASVDGSQHWVGARTVTAPRGQAAAASGA